jgi:hypothetical protein
MPARSFDDPDLVPAPVAPSAVHVDRTSDLLFVDVSGWDIFSPLLPPPLGGILLRRNSMRAMR